MLLVRSRRHPSRLVLRANRPWHRAVARLLAGSIDRRLAAGRAPESAVLLASRAEALVAPDHRRALARLLDGHAETARRGPERARPGSVPLDRQGIAATGSTIANLVALLECARPVPVRGVALVSLLLTDGGGPLFNRRSQEPLATALDRALHHLDPSSSFATAA